MEEIKKHLGSFSFDHVGIAVKSIEESLVFYKAMGLQNVHFEDVESEGVRVAMLELENNSRLELLEPLSGDGPIQKFLDKKGPCLLYTSPSPRDQRGSRMPSSA